MLDMELVESTIKELEEGETTFANCDKLASLYIIRQYNNKFVESVATDAKHDEKPNIEINVRKELSDILPHYNIYCDKKRDYQLNKVGEDVVLTSLKSVCQEITEFIHSLYSSTDMEEERNLIHQMIENL